MSVQQQQQQLYCLTRRAAAHAHAAPLPPTWGLPCSMPLQRGCLHQAACHRAAWVCIDRAKGWACRVAACACACAGVCGGMRPLLAPPRHRTPNTGSRSTRSATRRRTRSGCASSTPRRSRRASTAASGGARRRTCARCVWNHVDLRRCLPKRHDGLGARLGVGCPQTRVGRWNPRRSRSCPQTRVGRKQCAPSAGGCPPTRVPYPQTIVSPNYRATTV
jgi:hypothetical protein